MESEMEVKTEVPAKVMSETEKGVAKEALLISGAILLGSFIIAGAVLTLSTKPGTVAKGTAADTPLAAPANADPEDTNAVISLDDDPILGDRTKAKVAIVEFSDYECPYCKRFHTDTFDALVKEYVDTGKAVISFRDYPLSFHDPKATIEAGLAECVRKEKGDSAYFAFGKSLFANTLTNGKGLPEGTLNGLITKVGAKVASVTACAETDAVKQEIAKDMADAAKAGVTGTPSFVIGTLDAQGNVTGERVVGALPLSGFKTVVEKYLSK